MNRDTELNERLSAWLKRQEPDAEALDRLSRAARQRLVASVVNTSVPTELSGDLGQHNWQTLLIPICTIAAVFIGLIVGWQMLAGDRHSAQVAISAAESASSPPIRETGNAKLFSAVEVLFANQLAWIAETDDAVCVGLDDPVVETAFGNLLVIHLKLESLEPNSSNWRRAWNMDVVTHPESIVRWTDASSTVELWTHVLPDGNLVLEGNVALAGSVNFATAISDVTVIGIAKPIYSTEIGNRRYRLMQQSSRLGG